MDSDASGAALRGSRAHSPGLRAPDGTAGQGTAHAAPRAALVAASQRASPPGPRCASGVSGTHRETCRGAVGAEAGHRIPAAMVLTQDLAKEAPDGRAWVEQAVAVPDAMVVEGFADVAFGQRVGEGRSLVTRKASADLLQGRHAKTYMIVKCTVRGARRNDPRRPGIPAEEHRPQSNDTSLSVSRFTTDACVSEGDKPYRPAPSGLGIFRPFSGYGTTGRQGTEVTNDAELVAKTQFTSKLVPFVSRTGAAYAQGLAPSSRRDRSTQRSYPRIHRLRTCWQELTSGRSQGMGYSVESPGYHPPVTGSREWRGSPGTFRPANRRTDARPASSAARGGRLRKLYPQVAGRTAPGGATQPRWTAARAQSVPIHCRGAGPLRLEQERA
jgi:hypothetical protein